MVKNNLIIGLDLDGTLYDTFYQVYQSDVLCFKQYGLKIPGIKKYKSYFNTKNWNLMYRSLGIPESISVSEWKTIFSRYFATFPVPILIPGSVETVKKIVSFFGKKSLYFITSETSSIIAERFAKDGLSDFIDNVISEKSSKTDILLSLISQGNRIVYYGDTVSDGEACLEASNQYPASVYFGALVHQYGFNHSDILKAFVDHNKKMGFVVDSVSEIFPTAKNFVSRSDTKLLHF